MGVYLNNLATLYEGLGRYAEAEPLLRKALVVVEKQAESLSSSVSNELNAQANLARTLKNLGSVLAETGRKSQAEPLYRRALEIRERNFSPESAEVGWALQTLALQTLAYFYLSVDEPDKAEPLIERWSVIAEKTFGANSAEVADVLQMRAAIDEAKGRHAAAEPRLRRALAIHENIKDPVPLALADALERLAGWSATVIMPSPSRLTAHRGSSTKRRSGPTLSSSPPV
jgi:tetratricopeptide (TPR) repeat protein